MATIPKIKNAQGQVIEQTPSSITAQSIAQGTGAPSTPMGGGIVAGATPKQQDMIGTPAQQQNARRVEAAPATQNLETVQRQTPIPQAPTDTQTAAKEKAATLQELGPVRTRIESLIKSNLDAAQAQTASVGVSEAQIAALPPAQQATARAALQTYLQAPTEQNLKTFHDIVGGASLEGGGLGQFISGADEAIKGVVQGQMEATAPTLGNLQLDQIGVSMPELASSLGKTEAEVSAMTMDQLDAAIDSVEAAEFSQVDQLRAQLADPNAPAAIRQQASQALHQLGSAGLVGVEEQIDALDQQLASAQTIKFLDREMRLEEALGDDGISAIIAQAVMDPKSLAEMKKQPGMQALAGWIETNKAALETMVGGLEVDTKKFLDVQKDYYKVKNSLGADGQALLKMLVGDLAEGSVLGSELASLQGKLQGNTMYQYLADPKRASLLTRAKGDSDFLQKLRIADSAGITGNKLDSALKLADEVFADPTMKALAKTTAAFKGANSALGFIPTDAASLQNLTDLVNTANSIEPYVWTNLGPLLQRGTLTLGDAVSVNSSRDPEAVVADILDFQAQKSRLSNTFRSASNPAQAVKAELHLDGTSYPDIAYKMLTNPEAKARLAAIFDMDGDGQVSRAEWESADGSKVASNYINTGGLSSLKGVIDAGGDWNFTQQQQKDAGLVVGKGSGSSAMKNDLLNEISRQSNDFAPTVVAKRAALADVASRAMGNIFNQAMRPDQIIKEYNGLKAMAQSTRDQQTTLNQLGNELQLLTNQINEEERRYAQGEYDQNPGAVADLSAMFRRREAMEQQQSRAQEALYGYNRELAGYGTSADAVLNSNLDAQVSDLRNAETHLQNIRNTAGEINSFDENTMLDYWLRLKAGK